MNIEDKLVMSVINGLKALYGQDVACRTGTIAKNQERI